MTIEEIKARIAAIDAKLDDDTTTDAEFDALEEEARRLIAELGKMEQIVWLHNVRTLTCVNEWTQNFLASFGTKSQTRKMTLNQARIFVRLNNGKPFIYNGIRYDFDGINYRVGFSTLCITKV